MIKEYFNNLLSMGSVHAFIFCFIVLLIFGKVKILDENKKIDFKVLFLNYILMAFAVVLISNAWMVSVKSLKNSSEKIVFVPTNECNIVATEQNYKDLTRTFEFQGKKYRKIGDDLYIDADVEIKKIPKDQLSENVEK